MDTEKILEFLKSIAEEDEQGKMIVGDKGLKVIHAVQRVVDAEIVLGDAIEAAKYDLTTKSK